MAGDAKADVHCLQAASEVVALVQLLVNKVGAAGAVMFGFPWHLGPALSLMWSPFPRDDAFSDSLSQKADSEASSGPLLDDKASSKNDIQSPTDHIMDYGFGGVMGR